MYKATQHKSDFRSRVASHATKGSQRGVVRDLPKDAIEQFLLELEQFTAQAQANLEMAKANLEAVNGRLDAAHRIHQRMRDALMGLQATAKRRGWTVGRRKGAARSMRLFNLASDAINQLEGVQNALNRQLESPVNRLGGGLNTDAGLGLIRCDVSASAYTDVGSRSPF